MGCSLALGEDLDKQVQAIQSRSWKDWGRGKIRISLMAILLHCLVFP